MDISETTGTETVYMSVTTGIGTGSTFDITVTVIVDISETMGTETVDMCETTGTETVDISETTRSGMVDTSEALGLREWMYIRHRD